MAASSSSKASQQEDGEIAQKRLFRLTMAQNWKEVADIYELSPGARTAKLTNAEETALDVAISSYRKDHPDTIDDTNIERMINLMSDDELSGHTTINGNTVLHLAATVGWGDMCVLIALRTPHLIEVRNNHKETPLFLSVQYGNTDIFLYLHKIHKGKNGEDPKKYYSPCWKDDGCTILHAAINQENFKLAYQVVAYYKDLINRVNVVGESPLYLLASKPNVFKSSSHLGLFDSFIYNCVFVEEMKKLECVDKGKADNKSSRAGHRYPENYQTCVDFFKFLTRPIIEIFEGGFGERSSDEENPIYGKRNVIRPVSTGASLENEDEDEGEGEAHYYPLNYTTCVQLIKFGCKLILIVLGVGFERIQKIRDKKHRHIHAVRIMDSLIKHQNNYEYSDDGQKPLEKEKPQFEGLGDIPSFPPPDYEDDGKQLSEEDKPRVERPPESKEVAKMVGKKDTPVLMAAKMGAIEMVKRILDTFPIAIQDLDSDKKNVLLLAAEYRHTQVFNYFLKSNFPEYLFFQIDIDGNTILHLSSTLGADLHPWRIPGDALQMQWEIKWYKYVKKNIPRLCYAHVNGQGKTARQVFESSHSILMDKGAKWLTKTSESCSLVAALVATVAFATSATVPGGLNENDGNPLKLTRPAFSIFSVSSLVALCLSVTALVFFLAIITSRCQQRDFKSNLPKKLLMGLTALFTSIAAMLVSFCAGHTFILKKELKLAAVPIYTIACVPVTLFVLAQLPLYFDLLRGNFVDVPLRSYKAYHH
ncbi:uncharacterized protein LOC127260243 isoform X2 [Andrographis paniculata]|uniref:uncharacterized protein LOC127260243 isoform X2 n=1 Tax=Andrographis paniculata TaxID=175694 RepID=UPI0021E8C8B9|nr:uncharacterized protein LOC127260243 isoform X2 [Andrographis paniculata]